MAATKLAEAYVMLSARPQQLMSDIGRIKGRLTREVGEIGRIAAGLMAPLGAASGLGLGFAVKMASDAEETRSKFEAVFKELTDDADKFANVFAKDIGRSVIEVQRQMGEFQDTFVPLGFARDEAAKLSKQMTQLVADLGSFNNMADPEVQQLLTSALVGNHEAVRRFGVIITEASLKQELLNMGIRKNYKRVTAQQKVMARLNLIMKSTTDAQGDAKRTAEGYANSQKALIGALQDTAAALGGPLKNAMAPILRMGANAARAFADWNEQLNGMPSQMLTASAGFAALTGSVVGLRMAMRALGIQAGILKVALVGTGVGALVVAAGMATVGLIKLGKVLGGMPRVQKAWSDSVDKFREAWENVKIAFKPTIDLIATEIAKLMGMFDVKDVADFVSQSLTHISDWTVSMSQWLVVFSDDWKNTWELIKGYGKLALASMVNVAYKSAEWMQKAIQAAIKGEDIPKFTEYILGGESDAMKREQAKIDAILEDMKAKKAALTMGPWEAFVEPAVGKAKAAYEKFIAKPTMGLFGLSRPTAFEPTMADLMSQQQREFYEDALLRQLRGPQQMQPLPQRRPIEDLKAAMPKVADSFWGAISNANVTGRAWSALSSLANVPWKKTPGAGWQAAQFGMSSITGAGRAMGSAADVMLGGARVGGKYLSGQDKQTQLMQKQLEVSRKQLEKLDKLELAPVATR